MQNNSLESYFRIPVKSFLMRNKLERIQAHDAIKVKLLKTDNCPTMVFFSSNQKHLVFRTEKGLEIVKTTNSVGNIFWIDESVDSVYSIETISIRMSDLNKIATTYKESFAIKKIESLKGKIVIEKKSTDGSYSMGMTHDTRETSIILSAKEHRIAELGNPRKIRTRNIEGELNFALDKINLNEQLLKEKKDKIERTQRLFKEAFIRDELGKIESYCENFPGKINFIGANTHRIDSNKGKFLSLTFEIPWCYLPDKCKILIYNNALYARRIIAHPGMGIVIHMTEEGQIGTEVWALSQFGTQVNHPHYSRTWCLGDFEGLLQELKRKKEIAKIVFAFADICHSYHRGSPFYKPQGHMLFYDDYKNETRAQRRAYSEEAGNVDCETLKAIPFPKWITDWTGIKSLHHYIEIPKNEQQRIIEQEGFTSIGDCRRFHNDAIFSKEGEEDKHPREYHFAENQPAQSSSVPHNTAYTDMAASESANDRASALSRIGEMSETIQNTDTAQPLGIEQILTNHNESRIGEIDRNREENENFNSGH